MLNRYSPNCQLEVRNSPTAIDSSAFPPMPTFHQVSFFSLLRLSGLFTFILRKRRVQVDRARRQSYRILIMEPAFPV